MRATRLLLALALFAAGLAAAWPFRHRHSAADLPHSASGLVDVPLRRPDIALEVSFPSAASPANLASSPQPGERPDLAALAPPPPLPHDFGPPAGDLAQDRRQWQPVRMKLPDQRPFLRRHRVTDGDSLERLAERYLGDAARAAEIFEANRDVLAAPDLLPLGRIIRIPPREPEDQLEPAK